MRSFLGRVLPVTGPYCLVSGATGPDGKLLDPRHWNATTLDELEREGRRLSALPLNVFFAVGSYAGIKRKGPIAKRAFYLDLDGKHFDGVEDSIRQLQAFVKAAGLPAPSIYVASGHGIHVYWCLDRDSPVSEWKPIAQALKQKCIDLGFAADKPVTADAGRILRLPGSLNRKQVTPIPCRVLSDNGTTTSLEKFSSALGAGNTAAARSVPPLVSNDDLITRPQYAEKTPEQIKSILTVINLPENGGRDLWITVCCALVEWSQKSDDGFNLFDDWSSGQPKYVDRDDCWKTWSSFHPGGGIGIGTLVRIAKEAGYVETPIVQPVPGPNASLQEQIAATVPTLIPSVEHDPRVISDIIASPLMIAAAHAVTMLGSSRFDLNSAAQWLAGEFVLVTDQDGVFYSKTDRRPMDRAVIDDLLTRYMPLVRGKAETASTLLRRHGTKAAVNAVGFYPGAPPTYQEDGRYYVNSWTPPPDMIPGTLNEIALLDDFWNYCFPHEEDRAFGEYLWQMYGHVVQHPAVKIASAPLLVSKEYGTGKTTLAFDIPRAFVGYHSAQLVSNRVLRSAFSDYLAGTHFLHFDEVHIAGKADSDDNVNSLKNIITGKSIEIHPKGQKPYNLPNRVFVTATSNYEDALALPANDERRWGVYYLTPDRQYNDAQKRAYFAVLHRFLTSPRGQSVIRWYFGTMDLTGFDPQAAPPTTSAKQRMVGLSQAQDVQILMDAINECEGPFVKDVGTLQAVQTFLRNETGKQYPHMTTKAIIARACRGAKRLGQRGSSSGTRFRPWVWRNFAKWETATDAELEDEMKVI